MRDSQKSKVYRAEREADQTIKSKRFTENQYTARLASIVGSKWMADNFPNTARRGCSVEFRTMGGAHAGYFGITSGRTEWVMNELILLHELAHVLHIHLDEKWDRAGHGRQYCEIYVKLVSRFIGTAAAKALKAAFRKHKVKVGKKRQLSAAQKIGNAAVLAAWREKQKQLAKGA